MIWDLRTKTTPIQRTPQEGHAYPIYSLQVVGTENAHNIVSISNDGLLCTWNMNDLSKPQQKIELKNNNIELNVTCMQFIPGDVNNFMVGTEEGLIYQSKLQ